MKLLLINPPIIIQGPQPQYVAEPLALAYLEPSVSQRGHEVQCFDALGEDIDRVTPWRGRYRQGMTNAQINERLKDYSPDAVGISCRFTEHFAVAREVAESCKKNLPNAPVIAGGPHVSMHDLEVLQKFPPFDHVVRGEGEETLADLLDAIRDGGSLEGILGLTYRNGNRVERNSSRPLTGDLDLLPMPNRKVLMMTTYFRHKARFGLKKNRNVAQLSTSRGCPYNCNFCNIASLWEGRNWRAFSSERVLKEVRELYHEFGARELSIGDENFAVNKKRVHAILDGIIRDKLGLSFTVASGMPIRQLDSELLTKLKNAGLYRLHLPIESGSREVLAYMRKKVDLDHAKRMTLLARRLGLWTEANFILGTPYETERHINETRNYILNSGIDFVHVFLALSLPGTDMLDDSIKEGLVDPASAHCETSLTRPPGSLAYSAQELESIRIEIVRGLFRRQLAVLLNPVAAFRYLYPRLNSWPKVRYFARVVTRVVRGKIRYLLRYDTTRLGDSKGEKSRLQAADW